MDKNPAASKVGIRPIPFGEQVLAIMILHTLLAARVVNTIQ